jgi:predicted metal-dependent enzyme (double-stranded beta helix superfamily)
MASIRPLRNFVSDLQDVVLSSTTEQAALPRVAALLGSLIATDTWLPDAFAAPDPEHYRQYLLYADPGERFSVVSFVWGPGQQTPIHDHRVWGAIGVLRGAELATRYEITGNGRPLRAGDETRLEAGAIDLVSPRLGDIHRVRNALADRPSISIHVYGANIGLVERRAYDEVSGAARPFVSGYSSAVCPNLWSE